MPNGPAEVFGFSVVDDSDKARQARQDCRCPFLDKMCWKQSRLRWVELSAASLSEAGVP
jgi:hypothetical protein